MWFCLAEIKGLTKSQIGGVAVYLKRHGVPIVKQYRNTMTEGSKWQSGHKRQIRSNYYKKDEAIQALIKETNQKLILEARPIVLAHLGVYA